MSKKVVMKLEFADDKIKQKAMKKVSGISGIESIAMDPKDKKLTVTGDIDPVAMVAKLRKICYAEIVSVGPAKEPEKKKEEPKKSEPKKDDKKDDKKDGKDAKDDHFLKGYPAYYQQFQPPPYYYQHQYHQHPAGFQAPPAYFNRSSEEDPNGCVIC